MWSFSLLFHFLTSALCLLNILMYKKLKTVWSLVPWETSAVNAVSSWNLNLFHITSFSFIVWTVCFICPWHFFSSPLSCFQSFFFHLSGQLFQKCDRTPGIILKQFNNMSDVTIFRGGQPTHIPCNSSGGKVLSFWFKTGIMWREVTLICQIGLSLVTYSCPLNLSGANKGIMSSSRFFGR